MPKWPNFTLTESRLRSTKGHNFGQTWKGLSPQYQVSRSSAFQSWEGPQRVLPNIWNAKSYLLQKNNNNKLDMSSKYTNVLPHSPTRGHDPVATLVHSWWFRSGYVQYSQRDIPICLISRWQSVPVTVPAVSLNSFPVPVTNIKTARQVELSRWLGDTQRDAVWHFIAWLCNQ